MLKLALLSLLLLAALPLKAVETVKVFILAGQSNMEGQGVVDLDHPRYYNGGKGILKTVMARAKDRERYVHLVTPEGKWVVRDDVFVRFKTKHGVKKGGLSIGFTGYEGQHHIGPELQFGHVVGEHFEEPVLLIKTAWGGKSLHKDFRPRSAAGGAGPYYLQMIREIQDALVAISTEFPSLAKHRPDLAGFVWFQGWNDMFDEKARAEYEENLVLLAKDIRQDLKSPTLPIVIGELGNGGAKAGSNMIAIRKAQAAAAVRIMPKGSAVFVETHKFARAKEDSPNVGHGHHWFGNAESYFLIGDALGKATVKLVDNGC
jgi:hypothetical protein